MIHLIIVKVKRSISVNSTITASTFLSTHVRFHYQWSRNVRSRGTKPNCDTPCQLLHPSIHPSIQLQPFNSRRSSPVRSWQLISFSLHSLTDWHPRHCVITLLTFLAPQSSQEGSVYCMQVLGGKKLSAREMTDWLTDWPLTRSSLCVVSCGKSECFVGRCNFIAPSNHHW